MTRVIHTGDTHLGYQQYHSPARRDDFLAAFRQVVEDAVEEGVDAVVHAGDLFHDRRPDLPDLLGALSVLRTLDAADIPFLAVVGNHETKRDAQWLDLFESLGLATRLGSEPVVLGETAVYGLDFVPRSRRADLDYEFEPHDADHAALVAHGLFEPFDLGDWDAREVLEEASVAFDAMLLGDNHTPQTAQVGDSWLTYCGSTERASADERPDRGYNIVEFDGEVTISRRGLETRPFRFVDVELAEGEGVERVREHVDQYDLQDAVVIVSVTGDGESVAPAQVEEFVAERGALVSRVTDRREVSEEVDVEVSFADPDDAVRERVRELGLSTAARDLDETIRASKVADSNVADEAERRVRELVEDDDAAAFEAAPDAGADAETAADRLAAREEEAEDVESEDAEAADAEDPPVEDAGADSAADVAAAAERPAQSTPDGTATDDDATPDETPSDETPSDEAPPDETPPGDASPSDATPDEPPAEDGTPDDPQADAQTADPPESGDGQASMEDYL